MCGAHLQGLISGRMHQREEVLHIKHSVGRDVRLEEVGPMIAKLGAWADRNAALLQRLELQTKYVLLHISLERASDMRLLGNTEVWA